MAALASGCRKGLGGASAHTFGPRKGLVGSVAQAFGPEEGLGDLFVHASGALRGNCARASKAMLMAAKSVS